MKRGWSSSLVVVLAACGGSGSGASDASTSSGADTTAAATLTGSSSATSTTGDVPTTDAPSTTAASTGDLTPGTTTGFTTTSTTTADLSTTTDSSSGGTTESGPDGPIVDVGDPQLYEFSFPADEADPAATLVLGQELAQLDTTVPLQGRLVVYLHGAGKPDVCGSAAHGVVLASMGFHVVHPCYVSDYGVANCGDDIGGCRLEAFEGVDHHPFIAITPPDSIETRVVKMLGHLQAMHPGGDWQYFIENGKPRWDSIIISGISHGASSAGVIGMNRQADRVVMLSGPLDTDQAWLKGAPLTAIDRFFALTHTADPQHPGHLDSFSDMMLPGEPTVVDGVAPPYDGAHRLVTSAMTNDGHTSTQAGGSSPKMNDVYVFEPVWRAMYGAD